MMLFVWFLKKKLNLQVDNNKYLFYKHFFSSQIIKIAEKFDA